MGSNKLNLLLGAIIEFSMNVLGLRTRYTSDKRLDGQVVVITGGNSGIGKETAYNLALRGAKVIIGCRDMNKANAVINEMKEMNRNLNIIAVKLDLSSFKSIREFAERIGEQESKIDILINNAGLGRIPEWHTEDGYEMQIQTNHLGPFLLTHLLLPRLKKAAKARIICVSSVFYKTGQIDFENINLGNGAYDSRKAYCQSKLANILFARELAKRLGANSTITTYSLHPGAIKTDIARNETLFGKIAYNIYSTLFYLTPEMGCQTTLYCALEDSIAKDTGFYYSNCRKEETLANGSDDRTAAKLWHLSTEMVNLEDQLKLDYSKPQALDEKKVV